MAGKKVDDVATKLHGFNLSFFRRFWSLQRFLYPAFLTLPTGLSVILFILAFSEQIVAYFVGLIPSGFYLVLGDKNLDGFIQQTLESIGIVFGMVLIITVKEYVIKLLNLSWRQLLTQAVHRLYYTDISYYQLNVLDRFIDNPDQRIASDINVLCQVYSSVAVKVVISPFTISFYSYRAYASSGWVGPTACFIFFFISTVINKLIMSPIVAWVIKQDRREGDFRYNHAQIRVNAESIAFLAGEKVEEMKSNQKLKILLETSKSLYVRQLFLDFAKNLFDYLGSILSYLVLAIPIFSGVYDNLTASELSALISQNAFVCIYLISSFSTLVDMSPDITTLAGVTHRTAELVERLEHLNESSKKERNNGGLIKVVTNERGSENPSQDNCWIILDKVGVRAPGMAEEPLVADLTLRLRPGENVLITGNSSAGKTSILRVLRGLWELNRGTISHGESQEKLFFLPQKPYLTDGSLRDQLIYPSMREKSISEINEETTLLLNYLSMMRLDGLLERTGGLDQPVDFNWYDVLSPGEMQRLSFIRLLHHRPNIAFLDEATSALDSGMEEVLYRTAAQLNITVVSVGHRASLRAFHHIQLQLNGSGGWTLEVI